VSAIIYAGHSRFKENVFVATYKLDIFQEVLPAIDQHDFGFLERQPEEARKGFAAPVVLRWASSIRGQYADLMLLMVNSRANLDFFDLTQHPDLQWRLLASCGIGINARHDWIPMPARSRPSSAIHDFLTQHWPEANEAELNLILKQFTRESFIDFVRGCGLSPTDEQATFDAYDRFTGNAPKKKTSKSKKR
jgi:hypothetical protein